MCVFGCMYVCVPHTAFDAHGGPKTALCLLELELQTGISCIVSVETQIPVLWESKQCSYHSATFAVPQCVFSKVYFYILF